MYKLVISDDEGKTTVVPLVRDEITIGRKEGNTIRLTERNVSRRHARLTKTGGRFTIEDLGSYNGVRVNGERVDGSRALTGGDQVLIGDYVLAVEAEGVDSLPPGGVDVPLEELGDPVPPARLVMLTSPAAGAEFAIQKDGMRVGRAEDLDIGINHKSISREHARMEKEGERIRIVDLGSANGVRVNGKDVRRADLQSGDIVELGEVQFRFVEKGEAYAFDPSRARKEAAQSLEAPSRLPLYLALLVLILALAAATAIAFGGEDAPEAPSATALPPAATEPAARPPAVAAALARCEAALEAREWQEAAAHADRARALDPGDDSARLCSEAARAQIAAEDQFQEGVRALDSGELDAAYEALRDLPSYSPRTDAPEVERARQGYVASHFQLARRALRSDPAEAERQATLLLEVEGLGERQQAEARRILSMAQRRQARRAPPERPLSPPPSSAPDDGLEEPLPAVGLEAARACLRQGDNACVVRALEGHADSASALALLIETLRTMGDEATARRHMRTFVARYPGDRRTPAYRDLLANAVP